MITRTGTHLVLQQAIEFTEAYKAHRGAHPALREAADAAGVVFCVTYNYSGYPMVKEARAIVAGGRLGTVRKVVVEYSQGWLNAAIDAEGHKQASWRTDPGKAGAGGAIGDIGSHAEQLAGSTTTPTCSFA